MVIQVGFLAEFVQRHLRESSQKYMLQFLDDDAKSMRSANNTKIATNFPSLSPNSEHFYLEILQPSTCKHVQGMKIQIEIQEFKCPYSDDCAINSVSRRFCQKCRLRKCFAVCSKTKPRYWSKFSRLAWRRSGFWTTNNCVDARTLDLTAWEVSRGSHWFHHNSHLHRSATCISAHSPLLL